MIFFKNKNKNTHDWNFPSNNGGQEEGISNAGIETFAGKQSEALCKEILQNSLDAATSFPIRVKFELLEMEKDIIPGIKSLEKIFESLSYYWKANDKATKVLNLASDRLKSDFIHVLKISDFNTTGLTGAGIERGGNFNNLVKSSGVSEKGNTSGGSFGIGKNAPFACSYLRTVLYSTYDKEKVHAFQGVARLATYENSKGEKTQGTGFYGETVGNRPLLGKEHIPIDFLRDEIGTDIFILGFRDAENWENSIIKSSLKSFFMAILEGKLVVEIGNAVINEDTVHSYIEDYSPQKNENDFTIEYFDAVAGDNDNDFKVVTEENFEGLGEIKLYLRKNRDYSKKIAYIRSTGMRILDKGNFRTPIQFSGVLFFKGEGINKFIRSLETPSHDKLVLENLEKDEQKKADKILKTLNRWISDSIAGMSIVDESEELEIEGMSHFLPDNKLENELMKLENNVKIEKIELKKSEKRKINDIDEEVVGTIEESLVSDEGTNEIIKKPKEKKGEIGGISIPNEDTNNKNAIESGEEQGSSIAELPKLEGIGNLEITKKKVILLDTEGTKYRILIESITSKELYLEIKALYEVGGETLIPSTASFKGESLNIIKHFIGPIKLDKNKKNFIEITFDEPILALLEVSAYAKHK